MEHDPVGHGAPPPPPPPPPPPVPEASLLEAAVGAVAPLGDWAVETLIRQQRFDHDLDEDVSGGAGKLRLGVEGNIARVRRGSGSHMKLRGWDWEGSWRRGLWHRSSCGSLRK